MHSFKTAFAPALIGLMLAASCNTAEPEQRDLISLTESSLSQNEAMSQFASILSKAAADNEDLRAFIHNQALEMFDNDYDVFYPFVKDMTVSGGKTFAQILSEYCTDDAQLQAIEAAVPKLTILVPDWAWLDAFSVNKWDTTDPEVLVGYAESGETRTLYKDGEANTLEEGEFPLSPTLIIKSNERMIASGVTRSGERTFAFKYPEFDKRNNPKELQTRGRKWYDDDIEFPVSDSIGNFVPIEDIDPLVIGAYNEFKDGSIPNACQRDYIYYGMSKSNRDSGVLNTGIRERLYRFRLDAGSFGSLSDDVKDPKLHADTTVKGKGNQLSKETLRILTWSGGAFDIKFDFYVACPDNNETTITPFKSFIYSCRASDLFDFAKVHRRYKHQTLTAQGVYKYYFDEENIKSKWFYPSNVQTLPKVWDIAKESSSLHIVVTEVDDSTTLEYKDTWKYKKSNNFNWSINPGIVIGKDSTKTSFKFDFGIGGNNGNTSDHEVTVSIRRTEKSDDLGSESLEFEKRIIQREDQKTINGVLRTGYEVNPVSFGSLSVTLLPVNIR